MKRSLVLLCLVMMVLSLKSSLNAATGKTPEFALSIPAQRHGGQLLDGRLLLLLSTDPSAEPRMQIGLTPGHPDGFRH